MGKAVFFGVPVHGHVTPTLALVAELVRRGEEVVYVASEEFRAMLEHAGAIYQGYDPVWNANIPVMENIFETAEYVLDTALKLMPSALETIETEAPDYIVHDALAVWGRLSAQRLGIPAVATCPIFAILPAHTSGVSRYDLEVIRMGLAALPRMPNLIRLLWRLRREYQRTGGIIEVFANAEPLNIVFTSEYFQPGAETLDSRYLFAGPQLSPRLEPPGFPFDRLEGKQVIYISLGTIYNEATEFYRTCFKAFGGQDCVVVLSVGAKTDISALHGIPANFIVRNRVPQLEVLERSSLFITHAGMNSATEGLYYGVPVILVPQGADQFMVACRVEQLGAGVYLNRNKITPERLRETAQQVIDSSAIRQGVARIQESFRTTGGAPQAADAILRYVHPFC